MNKKKVMVLFGGPTMEYYAACKAVGNAIDYIDTEKYDVIKVGITQDGKWFLTNASSTEIRDGDAWMARDDNRSASLLPERGTHKLLILNNDNTYENIDIDVAFPIIAGYGGEDGRLQGLFDLADIPYVGSGLFSSAACMDKEITAVFSDLCNLRRPEFTIVHKKDFHKDFDCSKAIPFGYPAFVKPARGGTSVGVARVENDNEFISAMEDSFKYDDKNIIEEEIRGDEIKVAVLGNDNLQYGAICKLTVKPGTINSYEAKQEGYTHKEMPAKLPKALEDEIFKNTEKIYKKLGCKGLARVDFFTNEKGELYFNEINTMPGLGISSLYSRMFEAAGWDFSDLLSQLIETAFTK